MTHSSARDHPSDPYRVGRKESDRTSPPGHGEGGPATQRTVVGFGFWIYLLGDIVIFAAFFAAYAVLSGARAGGPGPGELFERGPVAAETALLLLSSFTCGLGNVAAERGAMARTQFWLLATGLLGLGFLALELREFLHLVGEGAGPQRSAFLSAFFGLVGLHGLHIAIGLLWLGTMMAQLATRGFRATVRRRLMCFNLFWHALDIVWIGIFTMVYLAGMSP
ncbi:cytochrome o ubiquinol oxidase subunit III [Sphingopyxis terrae]|uniref:Cytochrome bo(3) ubiquinol oxidase subunit 3 n=1 Tax=Sphingopyxis terrae subsp. ummariensis TaxID=429001 RepID=A0A1Y6FNH1_9SPHN|nr:cytochrome o ubiquinol oxidase subunit III [Sphingopyxis terrae]PCF91355.1 cytochrome o ubiquinol oxidase subunit III [Sphingopyxis terrae subsp. ummariensis]SMQ76534.1 cytochrome bb3 quinol oxidase subunit 3 [Sphingopyxis terrae subsp. ummariensis]